ncbi:hypothetical protein IAR55_004747 [Kwoniella newhampshirensis]|uniref:DUF292-domain-containing protein n=1 Tax=Kwoniella newhampshirensis TaxID=1651941 RepID=A0AAW0YI10_9TREE
MPPWNGPRAKVQIRLSIQRLRTLQEKKLALAKAARRDIADLVTKGRVETARLRVEGLIQDDIYVELLELLELYAEKLQARFNLLDASTGTEPEPSVSDAVCAIVYAAPRTELKELQVLREILMHKYGRNFSLALLITDPPPESVPPRIVSKLSLYTPSKDLVDAYLGEIARGYGVNWTPEPHTSDEKDEPLEPLKRDDGGDVAGDGSGKGDDGGDKLVEGKDDEAKNKKESPVKVAPAPTPAPAPNPPVEKEKKLTEEEELALRFDRLKNLR